MHRAELITRAILWRTKCVTFNKSDDSDQESLRADGNTEYETKESESSSGRNWNCSDVKGTIKTDKMEGEINAVTPVCKTAGKNLVQKELSKTRKVISWWQLYLKFPTVLTLYVTRSPQ